MLEEIRIKNFQSLGDIRLQLAPFTVIVGRSSTGKSALTRAIRALTSNVRGTSVISHGERTFTVTATTEKGTVSLSRGGTDSYTVMPIGGTEQTFTKLAGSVPEEITAFLGIAPRDPINYASQFDMPYLLTASPAEVARILGDLTNVSTIYEAAREANRRRLEATRTLATRQGDFGEITARIDTYKGIPALQRALTAADEALQLARARRDDIRQLEEAWTAWGAAELALEEIPAARILPDIAALHARSQHIAQLRRLIDEIDRATFVNKNLPTPSPLPEIAELKSRADDIRHLRLILAGAMADAQTVRSATDVAKTQADEAARANNEYMTALAELGTCPTCHQSTKGLAHAH